MPNKNIKKCEIKTTLGEPNQLNIELSYKAGDFAKYYANSQTSAIRLMADGFDGYFVKDEEAQINGLDSVEITFLSSLVKLKKNRPSYAINFQYTGSIKTFIKSLSDDHYFTFFNQDSNIDVNCGALDNYNLLDTVLKKVSWTFFEAGMKTIDGVSKSEIIVGDFLLANETVNISNFFLYNNDYKLIDFKKKQTNTQIAFLEPIGETGNGTSSGNSTILDYSFVPNSQYPLKNYNNRLYIQNLNAPSTNQTFRTKPFSSPNTITSKDLYLLAISELKKLDNSDQYEVKIASKKFINAGQKANLDIAIKNLSVLNNQSVIIKDSKYDFVNGKGELSLVFETTVSTHGRIQKVLIDFSREFNNSQLLPKN